ncbi:MAG: glycosyltransferase family A protein [Vicinamibacterales bacterium]|nr:glycosyltransferase family A protein [Vicinamibacterales bacterium]
MTTTATAPPGGFPAETAGAPLVSVVVIFLNASRFLREAVDSVIAQTCTDWELFLVDDGSTDDSSRIALDYAAAHPGRVRVLEHPGHANFGMSASRNLGVSHARGTWVALLDSDDAWTPDHLTSLLALAAEFPDAEMAYGPGLLWHSWDGAAGDTPQPLGFAVATRPSPSALAGLYLHDSNVTPCPSGVMVRRETFLRLGGFEQTFRGMYEDQAFCFKAALDARVVVTPHITLLYRQHADSCCSVSFRTGTHADARLRFLNWARAYLAARHPDERALLTVINRQRFDIFRSRGVLGGLMRVFRRVSPVSFRRWLLSLR